MSSLHFLELVLLSKAEKKARRIGLSRSKNLVLGENDVGKSTLIKSLYHALGADVPQLNNTRWKNAKPIYILKFAINNTVRYVVRDERYFGLFNASKQLVGRYRGITTAGGFSAGINPLLNFNIQLEGKDGKVRAVGPAYYFLPFYIDQDEGWNSHWCSFEGLQAVKDYRKSLLDYHLGVRPQSYYDTRSKSQQLEKDLSGFSARKDVLVSVRDEYRMRKESEVLDLDPVAFKSEMDELVVRYNARYDEQQDALSRLKDARNSLLSLEQEILVIERAIKELESDYVFLEDPDTPDDVHCPTCGTEFHNSIANRFGVLDDVDYCRNLLDQKFKAAGDARQAVRVFENEYGRFQTAYSEVSSLLERRRGDISLRDLVRSEGYKDILKTIADDLHSVDEKQAGIESALAEIRLLLKPDTKLRSEIFDFYRAKMKESLNSLNVQVLSEADYNKPEKPIKLNALGSDLPRSLLAQHMSLLHTMRQFNSFVICPLVIDSPLQQEQDHANAAAIFKFITSGLLDGQQLVLGTLPSPEITKIAEEADDIHVIELTEKYGLLQSSEYKGCLEECEEMHQSTLRAD
jgi:hypothetical protein